MTCRHNPHDPTCTSYKSRAAEAQAFLTERARVEGRGASVVWPPPSDRPDAERYEIVDVEAVGHHLVLKVSYPSCAKCAYEGQKVMVFLNTTPADALRWKRIDPHFRDPSDPTTSTSAPSPAARFPASLSGWVHAITYARETP